MKLQAAAVPAAAGVIRLIPAVASARRDKDCSDFQLHTLGETMTFLRGGGHPASRRWTKAPVLDTTAVIDTRAAIYATHNGRGR